MHLILCKHVLGVHKTTARNDVLRELGRVPLCLFAQRAPVKNWERIRTAELMIYYPYHVTMPKPIL